MNIFLSNNNLFNLFLIKLNNIKLNFLLISIFFSTIQVWVGGVWKFVFIIWSGSFYSKKCLIISNFYHGYVKIHPTLQYLSTFFFIYLVVNKKINFAVTKSITLGMIIIAFLLGSLWALFQSIWGYYWSNDCIEYILLLFGYLAFIKLHSYYINKKFFSLSIFLSLLLLILLRLSLLHTKHNFFSKASTSKFFLFFFYLTLINDLTTIQKFKFSQFALLHLYILILMCVLVLNKLNFFYIKLLMTNLVIFYFTKKFYYFCQISKYRIAHVSLYISLYIYLYISIKYNLVKIHQLTSPHSYLNMFVLNQRHIFFSKYLHNIATSSEPYNLNLKYFNTIYASKFNLKKIINFF